MTSILIPGKISNNVHLHQKKRRNGNDPNFHVLEISYKVVTHQHSAQ